MFKAINEDLTMVKLTKPNLLQNKQIFVGLSILELSKVHIYNFYYNKMLAKFKGNDIYKYRVPMQLARRRKLMFVHTAEYTSLRH